MPQQQSAALEGSACSVAGDNTPRFAGRRRRRGHVESYFIRANHPTRRQALWIKATVLEPRHGQSVATVWSTFFDGDRDERWATKRTVPLAGARVAQRPTRITIADSRLILGDHGRADGAIGQGPGGPAQRWHLDWQPVDSPAGAPLSLFPYRRMIDGGFPRSKLLTPYPLLRFDGELTVGQRRISVERWIGMQGHNWGREHAWEYAWGQCCFVDHRDDPLIVVEGFSSRIKLAGLVVPRMSALVVRRGARRYRFDRLFDPWRQRATIGDLRWSVQLSGPAGEAQLTMAAKPEETVCLGYRNPDGHLSYCLNSKLAWAHLRVNPVNEDGFECESAHGGALELLQPDPDPRFPVI